MNTPASSAPTEPTKDTRTPSLASVTAAVAAGLPGPRLRHELVGRRVTGTFRSVPRGEPHAHDMGHRGTGAEGRSRDSLGDNVDPMQRTRHARQRLIVDADDLRLTQAPWGPR